MSFCTKCGEKLDKDDKFCTSCGASIEKEDSKEQMEEQEEEKEDTWECEYCGKAFKTEKACTKHEKRCKKEHEEEDSKHENSERIVVKEVHHQRSSGGGFFTFLLVIIFIVIIGGIIFAVVQSGELDKFFRGSGVKVVDPCERAFNDCNHRCGEGIISSLCKEKCTYQYNQCRKG